MTEITLGADDDGGEADPEDGGFDLTQMLDQLEEATELLQQNPELAQMFGIDLPDFNDDEPAPDADTSEYPPLNADNLLEIAQALEQYGRADMTVSELKDRIKNNPDQINQLIQQNG